MIISFAWTTDAIRNRTKTATRRFWSDDYAQKIIRAYRQGKRIHEAWNRSPRFKGKKVATIHLTREPYKQKLKDMLIEDFLKEGGHQYWMSLEHFIQCMGGPEKEPWVIEFEVIKIEGGGNHD